MTRSIRATVAGIVVTGFLLASTPVDARPRPTKIRSKFEANKEFGLGIMLGVPTGLAGKYYLGKNTALDFGVGVWNRHRGDRDALHLHADFLWHPFVLGKTRHFWVPLYFGLGARYLAGNNEFGDNDYLGLRIPGGIMLDFERTPIDIFLEFAFVFDFVRDDRRDRDFFGGTLGLRYYF